MGTQLAVERPVRVQRGGKWHDGVMVEMTVREGATTRAKVRTEGGKTYNVTLPDDDGRLVLTRGSTARGDGITGKSFPRQTKANPKAPKTHVCSSCGVKKDARAFPTDGPERRLGECRGCRDGRTPSGLQRIAS